MTAIGSHQPDWDPGSPNRTHISLVDVRRAYFNAVIDKRDKPTLVDFLSEDPDHVEQCGQLLKHMYGTRGAADGGQEEYSTMLESMVSDRVKLALTSSTTKLVP